MGFLNVEIITNDCRKFIEDNPTIIELITLDSFGLFSSLTSLDESRLSFNHLTGDLKITSSTLEESTSYFKRMEFSALAVLILSAVKERGMIKNITLIEGESQTPVNEGDILGNALSMYLAKLYKSVIKTARSAFKYDDFGKFETQFKFLGSICTMECKPNSNAKIVAYLQCALDNLEIRELHSVLDNAYKHSTARMIDYLDSYLL